MRWSMPRALHTLLLPGREWQRLSQAASLSTGGARLGAARKDTMVTIGRKQPKAFATWMALAVACTLALLPQGGTAALTDLSSTPLASSNAAQVKPNIM